MGTDQKYLLKIRVNKKDDKSEKVTHFPEQLLNIYFDPSRVADAPPYFIQFIPKVITAPGEVLSIQLPTITDNLFDNYTVIVDYGASFLFIKLIDGVISIAPLLENIGTYQLKFTLLQHQKYPYLSRVYTMDVRVKEVLSNSTNNTTESRPSVTNNAKIISVNATGYVMIRFKDELKKPENLSEISYQRIRIELFKEAEGSSELINYKLLDIGREIMLIRLYFKNISEVSKFQISNLVTSLECNKLILVTFTFAYDKYKRSSKCPIIFPICPKFSNLQHFSN
ncbi:UNKNOWN [Stylonychia lemnae]|uniref:Uncharacterized protein n=1 Tax=Stylonychia lemnae TaxID=5949 RepID=A0A078A0Q0_STYLE|nr:UNKNOWN [Stylonychia lemnae]|eukprot:CDW75715.1 UNKNOWN [Stylonychia lemnae]